MGSRVAIVTGGSSGAAVAHIPIQTYYAASKAAVESYTCTLANEVSLLWGMMCMAARAEKVLPEWRRTSKTACCRKAVLSSPVSFARKRAEVLAEWFALERGGRSACLDRPFVDALLSKG